jgi:hypothetical protein
MKKVKATSDSNGFFLDEPVYMSMCPNPKCRNRLRLRVHRVGHISVHCQECGMRGPQARGCSFHLGMGDMEDVKEAVRLWNGLARLGDATF